MKEIVHGKNCWPWKCVCGLQMNWEQTQEAAEQDD